MVVVLIIVDIWQAAEINQDSMLVALAIVIASLISRFRF